MKKKILNASKMIKLSQCKNIYFKKSWAGGGGLSAQSVKGTRFNLTFIYMQLKNLYLLFGYKLK